MDEMRSAMGLTPRQLSVAGLVSRGFSNNEVARELGMSVKTVEYHLVNVFARLGVRSRTQLTRRMLEDRALAKD